MSEPMLTKEVALSTVRSLSGTEGYPFHLEGELRYAAVLMESTAGVMHARLTVDEFEGERCPSVENLRAAAKRLAEPCHCGKALWAHREGGACKRFVRKDAVEDGWTKSGDGSLSRFRQSVPLLPGVPWQVCLLIEALRLAVKGNDQPYLEQYAAYGEAISDLRAGRDPDAAVVEQIYRRLHPHVFRGEQKNGEVPKRITAAAELLDEMDRGYAVSKEVEVP